jgi:hypothetical protein
MNRYWLLIVAVVLRVNKVAVEFQLAENVKKFFVVKRGIIFIDEISRLADTAPKKADVLLDVMVAKPGRLQIGCTDCDRNI